MLKRIIAFSLSQRILILLLGFTISVAGYLAFTKLPIDAFPDVSSTQVQIVMKSPGMTPEEVESRIVMPIEQDMLGIPHQTVLRSQSKYAIAIITLDFAEGTDPYWARQQVNERLSGVMPALPSSASGGIAPMTTPLGESFMFTLHGSLSDMEKRTLLDRVIRPQLRKIEGVADVNALGGLVRTFEVTPNLEALAARGLSLTQLQQAIELNNASDGAGRLNENGESLLIRSDSRVSSLAELGDIIVSNDQGTLIQVKDVAEVHAGALTRYGAVTENGQGEAVQGIVLTLKGANARQVVQHVREHLQEIEKTLPQGTTIEPFYDRGELVNRAIRTVSKTLFEAILLVVAVMFLFLQNWRATLIPAITVPVVILGTLAVLYVLGMTINTLTLFALVLAIGLLVDDAIVVVENVERLMHEQRMTAKQASIESMHEISGALVGITLVLTAVFIPMAFFGGSTGVIYRQFSITLVTAMAISLSVALVLTPALCALILKPAGQTYRWAVSFNRMLHQTKSKYTQVSQLVIHNRVAALVIAGALIIVFALFYRALPTSFLPNEDQGSLSLQVTLQDNAPMSKTIETGEAVRSYFLEHEKDNVDLVMLRYGRNRTGTGQHLAQGFIQLKPCNYAFTIRTGRIDTSR